MTIVYIGKSSDPKTGWYWKSFIGEASEQLTVDGDTLLFSVDDEDVYVIHREDIEFWVKALSEAQKYFNRTWS